jgi:serine/threonine-protein kinase
MSPEQARGDTDIDERADVYGCAAVLYELLTGRRAHTAEAAHGLLYKIIHESPSRVDRDHANIPSALADVVQLALSRNRQERPGSITEFAALLQPFIGVGSVVRDLHGDSVETLSFTAAPRLAPASSRSANKTGLLGALARAGLSGLAGALIGSAITWSFAGRPHHATARNAEPGSAAATARSASAFRTNLDSVAMGAPAEARTNATFAPLRDFVEDSPPPTSAALREPRLPSRKATPVPTSSFERRNPYE